MNKGYTSVSRHHLVSRSIGKRSAGTTAVSYPRNQVEWSYQEGSMFSQQSVQRAAARTTIQPQHHRVGAGLILGLHKPEDSRQLQQSPKCPTCSKSTPSCADEGLDVSLLHQINMEPHKKNCLIEEFVDRVLTCCDRLQVLTSSAGVFHWPHSGNRSSV